MSNLAKLSLIGAALGLLFLLVEHTGPAVKDYLFVQDCKSVSWVTDTCTESVHFWEYN